MIAHRNKPQANRINIRRHVVLGLLIFIPFLTIILVLTRYGLKLIDDGYYYLQIAYNLSQGRGFSFDGINLTNGFQPLWQLILVPIYWFITDKSTAAYAVTILQTLFFLGSGIFLAQIVYLITKEKYLSLLGSALWLLNAWFLNKGGLSGMETGLLVFCQGLALLAFLRVLDLKAKPIALGILLMLMTAARLDTFALVLILSSVLFISHKKSMSLLALMPSAIYLGLYFLVNHILFGHILPISGYIKSLTGMNLLQNFFKHGSLDVFNHFYENLSGLITFNHRVPSPLALSIAGIFIIFIIWIMLRMDSKAKIFVSAHLSFTLIFLLYYGTTHSNLTMMFTYYWFPIIYGLIIIFNIFVIGIHDKKLRLAMVSLSLLLLAGFNGIYVSDSLKSYYYKVPEKMSPEYQGVQFINISLPENAIIGSWDAGYIGYFANKPVINLDGYVNNFEYLEYRLQNRINEYLDKMKISHLANLHIYPGKKKVYIAETLGWEIIFEERIDNTPPQSTRFTLMPSIREATIKEFYIFKRPVSPQN